MDITVKDSAGTDDTDKHSSAEQQPLGASRDEREIDQILADSFPASDAPPWTLGARPARPKRVRRGKGD